MFMMMMMMMMMKTYLNYLLEMKYIDEYIYYKCLLRHVMYMCMVDLSMPSVMRNDIVKSRIIFHTESQMICYEAALIYFVVVFRNLLGYTE